MSLSAKEYDKAHDLLKEALTSQPANPELRAMYTHFLFESNSHKIARDFALATLRDHERHDIYALCAGGALYYHQARENKAAGQDAAKDRAHKFYRAAEFYEKALTIDQHCAFAAQGLAICLAEGTLNPSPTSGTGTSDAAQRAKNSRDALAILTKVRESVNDGSVYVNIGHCHFAREEWDRAIEAVRCEISPCQLKCLFC
jgi:RNA polymerase-associated protein CTR9